MKRHRIDEFSLRIQKYSEQIFKVEKVFILLCLLLFSFSTSAFTAPKNGKKSLNSVNVQAALIKNFTHLIEWPQNTTAKNNAIFSLCIHRSKTLEQQFKDIFTDKKIKGRPVNIQNVDSESLNTCDLIYMTADSKASMARILSQANQLGVLTISAQDGFGQQGTHINFYENEQRMAFELNKHALDRAGFQVSAQLYHYARTIR